MQAMLYSDGEVMGSLNSCSESMFSVDTELLMERYATALLTRTPFRLAVLTMSGCLATAK